MNSNAMRNPWLDLPETTPYVLASDRGAIDEFNRSAKDAHRIHLEHIPEPFQGRPDAPVVLLGLNPGYSVEDDVWHANLDFAKRSRANLVHGDLAYPFYLLDPSQPTPGHRWWTRRFRHLIEATSLDAVARSLLCVEYFPYHSRRFAHRTLRLASQAYSRSLVEAAIARGALIICMRSRTLWFESIPALERYGQLHFVRSVQNPSISPRNLPQGFDVLVERVRRAGCS